jgi:protein TonB
MDLQSNLIESSKRNRKHRGWKFSLGSLGVHGLIIALILVMGATATHKVAAEDKVIRAFVASHAAPPPPPPPPPPPAASSTPKPTPVTVKPVQIPKTSFVQPREIPKEVPKVEPTTTTVANTAPSTNDQPAGEPGGVPGGVAGGVGGGVQGGVVGGTVGGVLGGELGGQKGGVVGGQVGGTGTDTGPQEKPEGPLRVGGDVKAPVVQHRVDPTYPDMARKTRVAGVVIVEAIINKSGEVEQVKVLKGLPMGMSESAVEAVKQWKFKPGTLNGEPVDVIFNLTVTFKLD